MRNFVKNLSLVCLIALGILNSCKPDETYPVLSTTDVTSITGTSCISGGTIMKEGYYPVINRGVCWSKHSYPNITDNITSDGTGKGTFVSNITGLKTSTAYYLRAYATDKGGTGYGNEVSFTTSDY